MNGSFQLKTRSGKLLVCIVGRDHGERVVALTKSAGARGGTILLGNGTAESSLLQLLGIGTSEKDIVFTLLSDEVLDPVLEALQNDARSRRKAQGIAFSLDVPTILQHVFVPAENEPDTGTTPAPGENAMPDASHELISVIVNAGYADDVMHAARRAGARGGTVINARGTGKEEDVKFFGITIVPEKELLLILATKKEAPAILEAVRAVPCLSERGMGIAFCMNVEHFVPLGK